MRRPSQLTLAEAQRPRAVRPSLTVLPDAARVEEHVVRKAAPFAPGRFACTFGELERDLVRSAGAQGACGRIATAEALALAFREACRGAREPYARIREQPGFARAAEDLLATLAQGMLEPRGLRALAESLPAGTRERAAALADVLCAARDKLEANGLVDEGAALLRAVSLIEEGAELPRTIAEAGSLVFEWIRDWTPLRVRLLAALAGRMGPGRVRVRLPWPAGEKPELREALDPVLRAFESLAGAQAPEIELVEPESASALAPFLRRLFGSGPAAGDGRIVLRACASPEAQAREAAMRCADLLAGGASPDRIAIVARSFAGAVREEIAAALDRVGIAWRARKGRAALAAPPVRLALSFYDLVEEGFPLEPLETLLCSRLVWLPVEGGRLAPERLIRRLHEARAVDDASEGGYDARLLALASRIEARAEAARKEGRAAPDPVRARAEIDEARGTIRRIQGELRTLPERATIREHAGALLALLDRFHMRARLRRAQERVGDDEAGPLARASAAALARDQSALVALEDACAGLLRAADSLGEKDRPHSRREWAQALGDALARTSLHSGGARGGAIELCELPELCGRRFDHLVLVNLVDGQLPAPPPVDPLLGEDDRRAVNRVARRVVFRTSPGARDSDLVPPQRAEEPLLFHLALCAADATVTLLWPRLDERGRETVRSPFADEAIRALGLSAEEQRACSSPLSPVPRLRDCRTVTEVLSRAALECLADPAFRVSQPAPLEEALALAAAIHSSPGQERAVRVARAALAERERLRVLMREIVPGRFSGQLSGAALDLVQQIFAFDSERPLSARSLEEYATCGFRTFAHKVLGIDEGDELEDDLAARERGSLAHRCLERFFSRLASEGRLPLRGTADELETLREIAEQEMDAFALREHVGRRSLWAIRRGEVLRDLCTLVEAEASADGYPTRFEQAFGYPGAWDALRIPDDTGTDQILVRGMIDRIDEAEDGSLLVLDYKSSSVDTLLRKLDPGWLLRPEFQLPIYLALVRQIHPGKPVDGAFVSLKKARRTPTLAARTEGRVDLDRLLELDPARRARLRDDPGTALNLADEVWKLVRKERSGTFPVDPVTCDYCDLKPSCRLVALPTDPEENGSEVPHG